MGDVIRFRMKHQIVTWESLGGCSVCCGWEGEMPSDCPGEAMTLEQKRGVLDGELDFLHREGWTKETRQMRLIRKMICEEGYSA